VPAPTGPASSDTADPETAPHEAGDPQAAAEADDAAPAARPGGSTRGGPTAGGSTAGGPAAGDPAVTGNAGEGGAPRAAADTTAEQAQIEAVDAAADTDRTDRDHADTDRADRDHADDGHPDDLTEGHSAAPDAATDDAPTGPPASPRPRPTPGPGPNGTFHDLSVPSTPYRAQDDDGVAQNGTANGAGRYDGQYDDGHDDDGHDDDGHDGDRYDERNEGPSPSTTPLPLVPVADAPAQPDPFAAAAQDDPGADALFAASVPAMSEPEDLPRSRRPLAELRRGPVDIAETTPIFEEIASAWFASHRPVPVDWELGRRPGDETESEPAAEAAPTALDNPDRPFGAAWPSVSPPVTSGVPVESPPAQAFATAADEGWRAASGAAAERPDELTAAGLPKRRPRARLVPGSAGSAVLAAPASPTRSAESIRGRLASYQQGVRQGRETRLRRDPGSPGSQPDSNGENVVAPAGGEHDEETR
jgi:hypothetical protein